MDCDSLYTPTKEEINEILLSRTAKAAKAEGELFSSINTIRHSRMRMVILQCTADGIDTVQLLITPSENNYKKVFSDLVHGNVK
jgi:hypothetical protein